MFMKRQAARCGPEKLVPRCRVTMEAMMCPFLTLNQNIFSVRWKQDCFFSNRRCTNQPG